MTRSRNKTNAVKVELDGRVFDSKKEAKRYAELKLLEKAGKISELRCQVKYELIPAQYETIDTGEVFRKGNLKGEKKYKKTCLERAWTYTADFVYIQDGKEVVEDVKGYRDPSSGTYARYTLARKMMLHKYGIKIQEV